jgi:hypothetical protein
MQRRSRAMTQFQFDPPLTLEGDIAVVTLDDAAAFTRSLVNVRLPRTRDNVLRWLERAGDLDQQSKAADMFRVWAQSEGVLPRWK